MAAPSPDPHNLASMARKTAPIIDTDHPCDGCGYNLRGLRLGVNCPECGLPSGQVADMHDPLSMMPMRVIVAFIRGCWVASLCIGLLIALAVCHQLQLWPWEYSAAGLVALAMAWVGAAAWLTPAFTLPQAVSRGFAKRSRLRRTARHLQWGWALAAGCTAVSALVPNLTGGLTAMLSFAQAMGLLTGLVGVVLLCVLLERLAEWACDTDAQRMFNWSAWSMPIATLLMLIIVPSMPTLSMVLRIVAMILGLIALVAFPYGLLLLSKSVTLSILHSLEYRQRMERRQERTEQFHQQTADAVRKIDAPKKAANQRRA